MDANSYETVLQVNHVYLRKKNLVDQSLIDQSSSSGDKCGLTKTDEPFQNFNAFIHY